ncbi:hypothetical protein D9M68_765780 [compost metagenome]
MPPRLADGIARQPRHGRQPLKGKSRRFGQAHEHGVVEASLDLLDQFRALRGYPDLAPVARGFPHNRLIRFQLNHVTAPSVGHMNDLVQQGIGRVDQGVQPIGLGPRPAEVCPLRIIATFSAR